MQDGIIAGNGNSRYLKTVATALSLYPDYESFMATLIAGTFPIDLNGINAGGWTQQGTALNKENLLSDKTATSIGLDSSATVNTAIAKLKSLIDAANTNAGTKLQIYFGSYVGTGTGNVSITAPFPVKLLSIYCKFQEVAEAKYFTQIDFQINPNVHNFSYNNLGGYQFRVADSSSSAKVGSISWSNSNKYGCTRLCTGHKSCCCNLPLLCTGVNWHYVLHKTRFGFHRKLRKSNGAAL